MAEQTKGLSRKNDFKNKHNVLKQEYDKSWKTHHKLLRDYLFPSLGRFDDTDNIANDHRDRFGEIISGEAMHSLDVSAAGLQAGLTSPARPWFKLTLADQELAKFRAAKIWLDDTTDRILRVMFSSNFYTAVHSIYREIFAFGTGLMFIDQDPKTVIRCRPFTMGEYYINHDHNQRVDTMCRPFKMQAINLVNMFGEDNVSEAVMNKIKSSSSGDPKTSSIYDWIDLVHFVEPNKNREFGKEDNKNMAFQSVYYETSNLKVDEQEKFLSDKGYNDVPFMGIRWSSIGNDVWGTGPGSSAKGDSKMLQTMMKKYLAAINKTIDPPMNAPAGMIAVKKSTLPGGVNYFDISQGNQGFSPTYQINFNFEAALEMIKEVKNEIRRYLHADLFQLLANLERSNITAFEISKRLEEKRLTVGPLIERFHPEFADPAINRIFKIMQTAGMIKPPPPELEGKEIQIEIISILAQAQKLAGTVVHEQVAGFAGNLAAVDPTVLDVLDLDKRLRKYSELSGDDEEMLRSEEDIVFIRSERAKKIQAQEQGEAMLRAAEGAKLLSETDTGSNNALTGVMGRQ